GGGLEDRVVVLGEGVADQVEGGPPVRGLAAGATGRGVASHEGPRGKLLRKDARHEERPLRRRPELFQRAVDRAEPERKAHQRCLNGVPRAWIDRSTPIAARFAIIDDPPTLTNGSGMPVIGAMPIVMPTLT